MGEFINSLVRSLFGDASGSFEEERRQAPRMDAQSGRIGLPGSIRNDRLLNEVLMIAPRFSNTGGIYYDEANLDWIMIPRYPLPERWQERWSKLLIVPPSSYPQLAPLGFYLNKKFRLKAGGSDPHATGQAYHGAPDLLKSGWHWYCVTVENGLGGWHPSADYRQPDNLWTFLNMVRESLTNDF